MAIEGINFSSAALEALKKPEVLQAPQGKESGANAPKQSFSDMFSQALNDVDGLQQSADKKIEGLMLGKENVTTHDAMIALEKADIAFQLMNAIRGKIVKAYEEVMRTQV